MSYSISYYPQAEEALSSLDSEERSRLLASIRRLAETGLSDSNIAQLEGIANKDPAYVFQAGNNLRVVFTADQDSITVLDVFNRYFAERYG